MSKVLNNTNVGLAVATWLAADQYDYVDVDNYLSATELMKPLREIILRRRMKPEDIPKSDVLASVSSRMGTAIHDAIEGVWVNEDIRNLGLKNLGIPKGVREAIYVNPTKEQIKELDAEDVEYIPVYMEQRVTKEIAGFTIGGKFDFCAEGVLADFKSTKCYTYINKTKDEDYPLQGSIYRWLNSDIVTEDYMDIHYIFTDWNNGDKLRNPKPYPPEPIMSVQFNLMSPQETERWIRDRVNTIKKLDNAPQSELPQCNEKELWRKPTVYKYYKNPAKANEKGARSTKNFDNLPDAIRRKNEDGNMGTVVEVKGTVVACKYCSVCKICEQKDAYLADGSLTL